MIDGSGSIRNTNPADGSYDNWDLLLEFCASIVEQFQVSTSAANFGAVTFGNDGNNVFYLNTYASSSAGMVIDYVHLPINYDKSNATDSLLFFFHANQ